MKFKLFVNRGRANGKSFAQSEYDAEMAKCMAEGKVHSPSQCMQAIDHSLAFETARRIEDAALNRRCLIEQAMAHSAITLDDAREAYGRASVLFADGKPVEIIPHNADFDAADRVIHFPGLASNEVLDRVDELRNEQRNARLCQAAIDAFRKYSNS